MTTLASSLLDFILSLFRDPELAAEFHADPERVLAEAGLGDVDVADCQALIPMVADYSPVSYGGGHSGGGHEDDDDHRPHHRPDRDEECDDDHDHGGRPNHDWNGHGHETAVIHNIRYVESHSTTKIDVDIDASHSIWAGGDAYAIWGDENVIATGGSVAAGDDVEHVAIDNSETDVDVKDSFNTAKNSFNEDTNIADRGGRVEDNDVDVEVDDVTIVNDSFNGATIAGDDVDQSTNLEVEDSLNGNTTAIGGGDATDVDVEIEDSLNGNATAIGGGDATDLEIEDSLVVNDSLNNNDVAVAGDDVEDVDQSSDLLSDNELDVDLGPVLVDQFPAA